MKWPIWPQIRTEGRISFSLGSYDRVVKHGENTRPEIIVNSTCPAGVKTELGRDMMSNPITAILGSILLAVGMKSAEEGAKTLVYAALTKPEENGKFFTFYQSDEEYLKWVCPFDKHAIFRTIGRLT